MDSEETLISAHSSDEHVSRSYTGHRQNSSGTSRVSRTSRASGTSRISGTSRVSRTSRHSGGSGSAQGSGSGCRLDDSGSGGCAAEASGSGVVIDNSNIGYSWQQPGSYYPFKNIGPGKIAIATVSLVTVLGSALVLLLVFLPTGHVDIDKDDEGLHHLALGEDLDLTQATRSTTTTGKTTEPATEPDTTEFAQDSPTTTHRTSTASRKPSSSSTPSVFSSNRVSTSTSSSKSFPIDTSRIKVSPSTQSNRKEGKSSSPESTKKAVVPFEGRAAVNISRKPRTSKPLLCTYGNDAVKVMTPFPDDGLCDFLFLESVTINEAGKLVSEVQLYDALRRLRTYAKTVTKTVAGISFSNRNLSAIISSMKSRKGSQEFKELRKDNVFGYGVLRATLHKSTSVKEVDDITTLFRALRKLQKRNKPSNTTEVPHGKSYVVLGMVILSEGTRAEKAHVRALFEDAISRNQLNALILRVDYNTDHHTDPKCRITGPNVWNGSYYEDQPTYANTLAFLKTVNYPKGIIVAFSLSTAAHFYQLPETNRTSVLGVGGRCVERTESGGLLTTRANVCDTDGVSQANSSVDPNSIQRYVVDSDEQGFFFVYDDISTVRTKMCLASKFNRKWRFSWAAVNIDMADDLSACNPNMTETFPTLRYMKSHMNGQFGKEACTKLVIE